MGNDPRRWGVTGQDIENAGVHFIQDSLFSRLLAVHQQTANRGGRLLPLAAVPVRLSKRQVLSWRPTLNRVCFD